MGAIQYVIDGGLGENPRRPSLSDVGGAEKVDDVRYPPDPKTQATASDWNQIARLVAGMGQITPICGITVKYSGIIPQITKLAVPGSRVTLSDVVISAYNIGVTIIGWTPGTFPPSVLDPTVTMNTDTTALSAKAILDEPNHQVTIKCLDNTTAGVNTGFTVLLY